ncbi:MAG: 16S rRNA (adenine(1518)-N(6)/adenine(1519)-N(6))-dimethyltransferase RsmA [Bryobacterales bacterium]|nr:16S rRNA (adenine(1518)-N(6)/adenine(1519)-N(6))-dimethyltransferase RsmA [Bryobacterales bacterium]
MSRQKLGQHFLRSRPVLDRIVTALGAQPGDLVVEIGPGMGALTELLLGSGFRVEAVELDPALVDHLRDRWPPETARLRVHHADVLETDLAAWGPAYIAGNLPYYITSPILRKLFTLGKSMRSAVLLMQLEVAERLVAKPGSRDYGFLSALTQWHTRPDLLFRVPPGAFHIQPKVESAVVRLVPAEGATSITREESARFEAFLGWCFAQKRKTLRNNLRAFVKTGVLETRPESSLRAEQLGLSEMGVLFRAIEDGQGWQWDALARPSGDGPNRHQEQRIRSPRKP